MRGVNFFIGVLLALNSFAQQASDSASVRALNRRLDSLYLKTSESGAQRLKLVHAEPLFIDLIRDLGARKGEREWNIGMGLTDNLDVDRYDALIEYEWAPVDRIGLEVELPVSIYGPSRTGSASGSSQINSIKLATQWTMLVNDRFNTSLALGYIHEFELAHSSMWGKEDERLIMGFVANPFFVAAKRWGSNWHSLIYTGPRMTKLFGAEHWNFDYDINWNANYMIPGTRNFVGLEVNQVIRSTGDVDITFRPQIRVGIADNLIVGIATGIPILRENERMSSFIRLIYEPGHRHHHPHR
jgi:hypothetical protein